jgi:hypothetical protein
MANEKALTRIANEVAASDPSRRNLAIALLGAFGGAAFLEACGNQGSDGPNAELLGSVAQAANGATLAWVDTVLGTTGTNGDLAANNSSGVGNAILVVAKGCVSAGDGGGGVFYWEADVTTGDDRGTIIVPATSPSGRWRRIYSGPLNVRWFGAIGGSADAAGIQLALNAAALVAPAAIYFPAGTYQLESMLTLKSGVSLHSDQRATITQATNRNLGAFLTDATGASLSDVTISGLVLDGNRDHNDTTLECIALGNSNNHARLKLVETEVVNCDYGFSLQGSGHKGIEFERCRFYNTGGSCIALDNSTNVRITNSNFEDCLNAITIPRQALSGNSSEQVLVSGNRFYSSGEGMMVYPIHFAGSASAVAARDVVVTGNTVVGPGLNYQDDGGGTADQIALYGVVGATVSANVSKAGGDGGIVLEDCLRAVVSNNIVLDCWGPGIKISNGTSSNAGDTDIIGNVVINNCKRGSDAWMGIQLSCGKRFLVSGNHCYDDTTPVSSIKQQWGLYVTNATDVVIGTNFFVYVANSGVGGDIKIDTAYPPTIQSQKMIADHLIYGHFVSGNPLGTEKPTASVTSSAGSDAAVTIDDGSNDTAGTVRLTTGTGTMGSGNLLTVTFLRSYPSAVRVMVMPREPNAASIKAYTNVAAASFSVASIGDQVASTYYVWDYLVIA